MKFVTTKKSIITNIFSPPLSFVAVFGSGIRDKHPGSGTLAIRNTYIWSRDNIIFQQAQCATPREGCAQLLPLAGRQQVRLPLSGLRRRLWQGGGSAPALQGRPQGSDPDLFFSVLSNLLFFFFHCCGSVTFWYGSVPLTKRIRIRILLFSSRTFKMTTKKNKFV